jgi:hypothetical protein
MLRVLLIAAAAALAVAPVPAGAVERYYSRGVYPPLQRTLTALSNQVPFALFDALIAAVAVWWVYATARDVMVRRKRGPLGALGRVALRTATVAAAVYVAFLLAWGLNYRRVGLTDALAFDATRVTPDSARRLARLAVEELNRQHAAAHATAAVPAAVDPALALAFHRAQRALGRDTFARPARPKRTLLDVYFKSAAVEGMTDPFFLETLVVSDLLPVERPAVIAHEWAHLAGIGHEGDANFAGWLTCMYGQPAAQYSGWLMLYREVVARIDPADRDRIAEGLAEGPRNDLRAIAERSRRNVRRAVADAGWRVYDGYLKANRVHEGAASYAEVVRLVLGTTLGRDTASGVAAASGTSRESPL